MLNKLGNVLCSLFIIRTISVLCKNLQLDIERVWNILILPAAKDKGSCPLMVASDGTTSSPNHTKSHHSDTNCVIIEILNRFNHNHKHKCPYNR